MTTRVLLILAGPTPWDEEGRLVGRRPLPLMPEAIATIRQFLDGLTTPVTAVARAAANEACDEVAKLIVERYPLRPRDVPDLDEVHLGLWEGLTPADLEARYPTAFEEWWENPLAVTPPQGEPIKDAATRLHGGLQRALRRQRGGTVAIPLRPLALRVVAGLLRREPLEIAAGNLHDPAVTLSLELAASELTQILL